MRLLIPSLARRAGVIPQRIDGERNIRNSKLRSDSDASTVRVTARTVLPGDRSSKSIAVDLIHFRTDQGQTHASAIEIRPKVDLRNQLCGSWSPC